MEIHFDSHHSDFVHCWARCSSEIQPTVIFLENSLFEHITVLTFTLRFRQVPSFGTRIRQFNGDDVSAMKKLSAQDFEDILQVTFFHSSAAYRCLFMWGSVVSRLSKT
jgi:hypothetical protein